jgi:hypothetical protein
VWPSAGIGIVNGRVDISQIDFAHKAINVKLPGEAGEARLSIDGGKNVESELFRFLDDDIFPCWIPTDHVVIFRTLEESVKFC